MAESAEEIYDRVVTAVGRDGRLPAGELTGWPSFPWEAADGDVVPKVLRPPAPEGPREGDPGGGECPMCAGTHEAETVWEDELWVLTTRPEPTGMPLVLTLWTWEHLDFGDLDDELASQFGRLSNRLVRIMQGLPHVGRVHVNRWGDGCAHFHVWYVARPAGLPAVRGSYAVEWDDILPPGPEDVWRADLHTVATKLANWGGQPRA